jgi:hypothetical protein
MFHQIATHLPPLRAVERITFAAIPVLAISLLVSSCATVSEKTAGPYGVIEAATTTPPIDLHRVVLQSIDGRGQASTGHVPPNISLMLVRPGFNLTGVRSEFRLPPGEHTLDFTAVVNKRDATTFLPATSPFAADGSGVLKINVEAGKRYYIAAHVNEGRPEQWEPVVYRTEDIAP